MPLSPKVENIPAIRSAIVFYRIASYVTGVMLLLLVAEMILKYAFHYEVFAFGPNGLLSVAPVLEDASGELQSTGEGLNLSLSILIAHGWLYVVYLFADFRLWSLMRWPFSRFVLIALGGVVPFLSFFVEHAMVRRATSEIAALEQRTAARTATPTPSE